MVRRIIKCFKCKRVFTIDVPDWLDRDEEVICVHCDTAIPVYSKKEREW
jgi:hypothetical protein